MCREHGDQFAEKIHQCIMNFETDFSAPPSNTSPSQHNISSNGRAQKPQTSKINVSVSQSPHVSQSQSQTTNASPTHVPIVGKKRHLPRQSLANVSYTPPVTSSREARTTYLRPRPQSSIPTTAISSSNRRQHHSQATCGNDLSKSASRKSQADDPSTPRSGSPSSRSLSSSSPSLKGSPTPSSHRVPRTSSRLHSKNISSPPSTKRAPPRTTPASQYSDNPRHGSPASLLARTKSLFHHFDSGSRSAVPEKISLPPGSTDVAMPRFPSPSPTNSGTCRDFVDSFERR